MLMTWEFERVASNKQCIECALVMWKEWMSKKTYTDDLAAEGTMGSVAKFLTLLEK